MEATGPALQHLPVTLRSLQQGSLHGLNHPQDPIASQLGHSFDPSDPSSYQPYSSLGNPQVNSDHLQTGNVFDVQTQNAQAAGLQNGHSSRQVRTPLRQTNNGSNYVATDNDQYNLIASDQQLSTPPLHSSISRLQPQDAFPETAGQGHKEEGGHFGGMKLIGNPRNLQEWRERLFNVDEMITLTEQEFQTYFPHVDNVYSHRSTQKYKRKPFVSHYWDCRLKGRPPGTPKSNDPTKKKRKRTARERDLCDVKIKITEYFPGAALSSDFGAGVDGISVEMNAGTNFFDAQNNVNSTSATESQPFGVLAPSANLPIGHPGANGSKYYTIQRVNGNTTGKGESAGGPHRHSLQDSDRVKKNSVQRWLLKEAKEKKRSNHQQLATTPTTRSTQTKRSTGLAALTIKRHAREADLKLFGNLTCPFTQRIWIALEIKEIPYQFVDVDASRTLPDALWEVSPQGAIPAIKHGNWGTYDSMVIMEYLEDLSIGHALLPLGEPQLRAHCRQWVDHINRNILFSFYTLLGTNDPTQQDPLTSSLQNHITRLVNASHVSGPFFLGPQISYVDVAFAPWIIRLSRVLKYFRAWPDPELGSRWQIWVDAVERDERVRSTLAEEAVYRDRYESVSDNRQEGSAMMELRMVFGKAGQSKPGPTTFH